MNTVREYWESFADQVLAQSGAQEDDDMRVSFYAGAAAMAHLLEAPGSSRETTYEELNQFFSNTKGG